MVYKGGYMKRKSLAALAMLPLGLFANSANASSETAAAESVVSYSNQQSGSMRNGRNQYDDQVQVRGQQPMEQEDQRYGFYIMGDYLYWVPYFSNMPYAQRVNFANATFPNPSNDTGVLEPGNVTTQNIDMSGDSGFRILASYQSDWQTVGFTAAWTRFHSTDTNGASNDAITGSYGSNAGYNDAIQGYWNNLDTISGPINTPTDVVFQANGKFQVKFDQLDFIFNTRYCPNDWVQIFPGMGLRSLLTTMQLTATQTSNKWGDNKVAEAPFNTAQQVMKQKFDTVGLVANINSRFDIYEGFRVVTGLALAYTIGNLQETNTSSVTQQTGTAAAAAANGDVSKYQRLRSDRNTFKPQVDADIGLQYEWINDEKTFGFLLEVAYEMHYLPNFIQFIRAAGPSAPLGSTTEIPLQQNNVIAEWSDLMFQGLRARAGISF